LKDRTTQRIDGKAYFWATAQQALEKLCAYEETGLTPERAAGLAAAEQEGRLVVLPCKIGDTVYWVYEFSTEVLQGKVQAIKISEYGIGLDIVQIRRGRGSTSTWCSAEKVFLTREEAEAALLALKEGPANGREVDVDKGTA